MWNPNTLPPPPPFPSLELSLWLWLYLFPTLKPFWLMTPPVVDGESLNGVRTVPKPKRHDGLSVNRLREELCWLQDGRFGGFAKHSTGASIADLDWLSTWAMNWLLPTLYIYQSAFLVTLKLIHCTKAIRHISNRPSLNGPAKRLHVAIT